MSKIIQEVLRWSKLLVKGFVLVLTTNILPRHNLGYRFKLEVGDDCWIPQVLDPALAVKDWWIPQGGYRCGATRF